MTNLEMAALFDELAEIMEIAGEDHFKIRAYRNVGKAIANSQETIGQMPLEKLLQIDGIGKAISEKVLEAGKTGTFPTLEKWRQSGFASLRPLLDISELSMRKLKALIKDLGIQSIEELKTAIDENRIDSYDKLDAETREKIKWMIKK